jgi:hypothetical protein
MTNMTRRTLLTGTAAATLVAAGWTAGNYWIGSRRNASRALGKKVIVIGVDGMDPRLSERMIAAGELPNLARLRDRGGFSDLGTSVPPQSPVAWATFINSAGPGSHGIFDFIHRHPEHQCDPFYSAAETVPGEGFWDIGNHRLQLDFWPFNHKPPATMLRRQGTPFWDDLDRAGIPSTFYDPPSNYPASPSHYGHHRCLCGMGTPDMLGTYGTYQHFAEDGPAKTTDEGGGTRSRLTFSDDTAHARLVGPDDALLKTPRPIEIPFEVHRDREANAAVIEIQGRKLALNAGQWSHWTRLEFTMSTPAFVPGQGVSGLCRFYMQQVAPTFRLYVSPLNMDPAAPAQKISEPPSFVQGLAGTLGPFSTLDFQESHKARSNGVFTDDEYARQAER